jgi:hypothetical protein
MEEAPPWNEISLEESKSEVHIQHTSKVWIYLLQLAAGRDQGNDDQVVRATSPSRSPFLDRIQHSPAAPFFSSPVHAKVQSQVTRIPHAACNNIFVFIE